MPIIKFMPPRVPITDPRTGLITREWYNLFQQIFERTGGTNGGGGIIDVQVSEGAGIALAELEHETFSALQDAAQMPTHVQPEVEQFSEQLPVAVFPITENQYLYDRIAQLESLVHQLQHQIHDLKQGTTL